MKIFKKLPTGKKKKNARENILISYENRSYLNVNRKKQAKKGLERCFEAIFMCVSGVWSNCLFLFSLSIYFSCLVRYFKISFIFISTS